jgi:transcription initiation factor TFIIIB Brf1 subunit/transcription initiation factor TFIIB
MQSIDELPDELYDEPTKTNDCISWDAFMQLVSTDEVEVNETSYLHSSSLDSAPTPISNWQILNAFESDEIKTKSNVKKNKCHICNGDLYLSVNVLTCQSCGVESQNYSNITEEEYSTSAITDCNVNSNGFISMRIIGPGSYGYNRALLKTSANYEKYRKINMLKDMNSWNNNSKKHHMPKNIMLEVNDDFDKIKKHGYVFRKDGKKGVISALLYYKCYAHGISKTPSEIAQFSGIEEKFHSQGDRILHDLAERGIIQIPHKVNPIVDYIERYMELLEIDKCYKLFIIDLISRADAKHIHVLHDSKANTKAVGAIYILVDRIPKLRARITKDMIEKECGISKTTFLRYYNIIHTYYKKVKKAFKKHKIPMPSSWR